MLPGDVHAVSVQSGIGRVRRTNQGPPITCLLIECGCARKKKKHSQRSRRSHSGSGFMTQFDYYPFIPCWVIPLCVHESVSISDILLP